MFFLKTKIIVISLFLVAPTFVFADYGGQKTTFFVDARYDALGREELTATLLRISPTLYFYIDDNWWGVLAPGRQDEVKMALQSLEEEFENNIYPTLTGSFGAEWKPGIDKDNHITVLIHPIKQEAGGYISTADEYFKLQIPNSNQREMVYLNAEYMTSPTLAKSFLAHEFMHLISFYQKEVRSGVSEEVWLNEGRAEYASTLLGYDEPYSGSNLQRRVRDFLQSPNDPLTEWKNEKADYGVLNMFMQYLVDQYGLNILSESLHYKKVGILSINETLAKQGYTDDFSQAFTNWTIAIFLNNCSTAKKYCYSDPKLKDVRVSPSINFLPLTGKTTLAVTASTKNWTGNWQKFIGGKGELEIKFIGYPDASFKVPYLVQDSSGGYALGFFSLDKFQQGSVAVSDFGGKAASLIILPTIQSKTAGFTDNDESYLFFWSASVEEKGLSSLPQTEAPQTATTTDDIQSLLQKMSFLEQQLQALRDQLKAQLAGSFQPQNGSLLPKKLDFNLKYGQSGDAIKTLQTWLAKDPKIYPEAKMTGYFGPLTQKAVIRFQEKYLQEVLSPFGLSRGTGFVGQATRAKLNVLYSNGQ